MLFLATPPAPDVEVNTSNNIQHEFYQNDSGLSILLKGCYEADYSDFQGIDLSKRSIISSDVKIKSPDESITSTWKEGVGDDFDIVPDIVLGKTFRIKARIKNVRTYTPNIVID